MATSNKRESAKIIPFPVRRRSEPAGQPERASGVQRAPADRIVNSAGDGAWYHDAAIDNANPYRGK